jgi:hypothetical protein
MLNLVCESCIFATELIIDFAAGGIAVSKLQKTETFCVPQQTEKGRKNENETQNVKSVSQPDAFAEPAFDNRYGFVVWRKRP